MRELLRPRLPVRPLPLGVGRIPPPQHNHVREGDSRGPWWQHMLSQLFSALAARTWAVGVAAAVAVVAVANWVASALLVWAKVVVKGDDVLTATSDIGTLKGCLLYTSPSPRD